MADSHAVAGMLAALASRVNNLAVDATGDDSRTLTAQQIQLTNLSNQAIALDLDNNTAIYAEAVTALNQATSAADAATTDINNVQTAITDVGTAISVVTKLLVTLDA